MADLTITVGSVALGTGGKTGSGVAGAAITQSVPVYLDSNTGLLYPALSDTAAHSSAVGIALNAASTGQPVSYVRSGQYTVGATLVVGMFYVVSANSGKIAPITDVLASSFPCILFRAVSTTVAQVSINYSTVAIAADIT